MTEARKLSIVGLFVVVPIWILTIVWLGYHLVDTKEMVLLVPMTIGLFALIPMYKLLRGVIRKRHG